MRDTKIGILSRWKKVSPLDSFQVSEGMFMRTYASSRVKRKSFYGKSDLQMFCWFPASILVHQNGTPAYAWRLDTKLYKGAWNVSANNSETVGHKDLRLGQFVYILVFITFHFPVFFHGTVSNLFFCCVIVKTIYFPELLEILIRACFQKFGDIWAYPNTPA